jgi:ferrochelatase
MNLGGPETTDSVHQFLLRLFSDKDLIRLPFQKYMARLIAWRRSPQVKEYYRTIGGGSPIRRWTEEQGEAMARLLDTISNDTGKKVIHVLSKNQCMSLYFSSLEDIL